MTLAKRNKTQEVVEDVVEEVVEDVTALEAEDETVLEAEEDETPVENKKSLKVDTKPQSSVSIAEAQVNAMTMLKDAGFDDVHTDHRSYPTVKLAGGNFETSDEEDLGSDGFLCRIFLSKKRYVIAEKDADDEDNSDVIYCEDLAELDDPNTEAGKLKAEWEEAGKETLPPKIYTILQATITDPASPINGQVVWLQISPASRGKFGGYVQTNAMVHNKTPSQYITQVLRGKKVVGVAKPFYPWSFKLHSIDQ